MKCVGSLNATGGDSCSCNTLCPAQFWLCLLWSEAPGFRALVHHRVHVGVVKDQRLALLIGFGIYPHLLSCFLQLSCRSKNLAGQTSVDNPARMSSCEDEHMAEPAKSFAACCFQVYGPQPRKLTEGVRSGLLWSVYGAQGLSQNETCVLPRYRGSWSLRMSC